jgi:hypothetical protein
MLRHELRAAEVAVSSTSSTTSFGSGEQVRTVHKRSEQPNRTKLGHGCYIRKSASGRLR